MIIGITGSFGSGKTTVANMFKKYNFKVINADKLYSEIYKKNKLLKNKIKKEFGTLDRNKIKKIVFNDYRKLKKLNEITHPVIIKEIKKQISYIKKTNKIKKSKINVKNKSNKKILIKNINYEQLNRKPSINNKLLKIKNDKIKIIIDAPLLLEAKAEKLVDKIIVVKRSKKEQVKRILKKGKYSKKEIENIIKSQMPLKDKIKKADFVVDNKAIKESEGQVKDIVEAILKSEDKKLLLQIYKQDDLFLNFKQ